MGKKQAYLNILTGLTVQIIKIAYGFVVPKIIISFYGSALNGLISSITQFLGYITLLESGFGPVVKSILYKPIANKDEITITRILKTAEKFFRRIAICFVIYILVLCFLYPVLINGEYETWFTVSLVLIIGVSTFAEYFFGITYSLFLQAEGKPYIIYSIQIILYFFATLVTLVLANRQMDIHIIKLVTGLVFTIKPLIQNIYVRNKYGIRLHSQISEFNIDQKWDGLAQHIASVIHENTDITVLTLFSTFSEISVYSVYSIVIKGIKSVIQGFTAGIDASFGRLIAEDKINSLREFFTKYEVIYDMVITVVFSCTFSLILPFVRLYTANISDADYIRPIFSCLLVASELIWAIRLPYVSLTLSAGHFRQTRLGAIIECVLNIILSIILVIKYGLNGVAIGTIIAMLIRTAEFVNHVNSIIIKRDNLESCKNILVIIVSTILCVLFARKIGAFPLINYFSWLKSGLLVFIGSSILTVALNLLFNGKALIAIVKRSL